MNNKQKEAFERMRMAIEAEKAAKSEPSPQPATQSITNAGGIESQERVGTPGGEAGTKDQE